MRNLRLLSLCAPLVLLACGGGGSHETVATTDGGQAFLGTWSGGFSRSLAEGTVGSGGEGTMTLVVARSGATSVNELTLTGTVRDDRGAGTLQGALTDLSATSGTASLTFSFADGTTEAYRGKLTLDSSTYPTPVNYLQGLFDLQGTSTTMSCTLAFTASAG